MTARIKGMRRHLKRGFLTGIAIIFLLLGIVGLVLPFLQGILFIAIGLILLSLVSVRVRQFLDRHTVRFPRVHKVVRNIERAVGRIVGDV